MNWFVFKSFQRFEKIVLTFFEKTKKHVVNFNSVEKSAKV